MPWWFSHIGAYAWVENLVPTPVNTVTLPDGRSVQIQAQNGGFVHAPSMAHAATAAVLRSAYLSHDDEPADARRYAFDLTSARVRAARSLLDGVREGQPIGALLGYGFERSLQERALEVYLAPFRKAYPLVASKSGVTGAAVHTQPGNVADGLAIRTDWHGGIDPIAKAVARGAPDPTSGQHAQLEASFRELDAAVDAVSDLLTAEGVFQTTRGNVAAASASIDALASGVRPPDPEVARTPRGGTPITHRVLWLSELTTDAAPGWAGIAPTVRSTADPTLDHWIGELLGNPGDVVCWVGPVGDEALWTAVTLAQLGLRPVDVLELARAAVDGSTELERRILDATVVPAGSVIHFERAGLDRRTQRTFPELLETARQVSAVLARVRPAAAGDLALLDGSEFPPIETLVADEEGHASAVAASVSDLRAALVVAVASGQAAAIRAALAAVAQVQSEAYPPPPGAPGLESFAVAVRAELDKRLERAAKELARLTPADGEPPTPRDRIAIASAVLKALLGESFTRLCPFQVSPEVSAQLGNVGQRSDALLDGDPQAPSRLVHQVARVRPSMTAWRQMWLFVEAMLRGGDRHRPGVHVAQLPYDPVETWVGRDFQAHARPSGSRLSLVLHHRGVDAPRFDRELVGLAIDEWTEIVPNAEEQTGVAFHYDDPGAEAPQAVLIAVPPDRDQSHWSFEHLVAAIRETFELAKIRAVEPEALGALGHVLPATYLSSSTRTDGTGDNPHDRADDVSTRFDGLLTGDPVIKVRP
jgi:hypothetical protein